MARMQEKYRNDVVPALMQEFSYGNVMQVPKVQKIVVNIGLGEAVANPKALDAAVGDLTGFWTRRNPEIRFERNIRLHAALERRHEEAAYRIVQEAVSNAVRHGNPGLVRVDIQSGAGQLTVTVQDDGGGAKKGAEDGFSLVPISLGQAGIAGMRERVLALKGSLDIEDIPGRGVRLCAVLPLAREVEPA